MNYSVPLSKPVNEGLSENRGFMQKLQSASYDFSNPAVLLETLNNACVLKQTDV